MKCETAILQDEQEIDWLIQIFQTNSVRSYLEIGSKHGGSLWRVANALPAGSRIVAVDLPHGDGSAKDTEASLVECMNALLERGYDASLIIGDSTNKSIIKQANLLGPYDACFIDANHTLPYVTQDWKNYGSMARIVAFHDISWWRPAPRSGYVEIAVPEFWNELKSGFRYEEIRKSKRNNGIGVLWRL
jgi:predicted O-methyltransferase YrrM